MNRRDIILAPLRILVGLVLAKLGVRAKREPAGLDALVSVPQRAMTWQDAELACADAMRHPWEHYNEIRATGATLEVWNDGEEDWIMVASHPDTVEWIPPEGATHLLTIPQEVWNR